MRRMYADSMTSPVQTARDSVGSRLVDTEGHDLPFKGCSLKVQASGGLAQVTLLQRFRNESTETLRVLYTMPLPADGAGELIINDINIDGVVGFPNCTRRIL